MNDQRMLPGIYKVAPAAELEKLTRAGWRIIQSLSVDEAAGFAQDVILEAGRASYPAYNGQVQNTEPHTYVVRPRELFRRAVHFLLVLDEASALAQATEQLDAAAIVTATRDAELVEVRKEKGVIVAELARVADVAQAAEARAVRAEAARRTADDVARKMEVDVAKVRTALGAERMNEILGPF